jgi:MFS family permease
MTTENKPQTPIFTAPIRWFLFTMIVANVAARMVYTLLAVHMVDNLGATVEQVGLTFTLAGIVPMILNIFGGWLSDTIGRLPAIAIGASVSVIGYFGFVAAPTWGWIVVALTFEFISGSLVGPSFMAYLADQSSEENRGKLFGTVSSLYQVVGIIGPPLGGFLAYNFGFKTMLYTAAGLYTTAAVFRIWMALTPRFYEERREATQEKFNWPNFKSAVLKMGGLIIGGGILTWIFITDGVRDFSYRISTDLEPVYLSGVGGINEQQIGYLTALSNITLALALAAGGWLVDKIKERAAIVLGFLIQFTGFMIFIQASTFWGFALSWMVLGVGFGIMGPAYDSIISKAVPEENRGLAYGLFWSSISLLALPAPFVGGLIWEATTPQMPFLITAIVTLLVIFPVWFKFKVADSQQSAAGS